MWELIRSGQQVRLPPYLVRAIGALLNKLTTKFSRCHLVVLPIAVTKIS